MKSIEGRAMIKIETIGIKMIYWGDVKNFKKVFDNGRLRIYKLGR